MKVRVIGAEVVHDGPRSEILTLTARICTRPGLWKQALKRIIVVLVHEVNTHGSKLSTHGLEPILIFEASFHFTAVGKSECGFHLHCGGQFARGIPNWQIRNAIDGSLAVENLQDGDLFPQSPRAHDQRLAAAFENSVAQLATHPDIRAVILRQMWAHVFVLKLPVTLLAPLSTIDRTFATIADLQFRTHFVLAIPAELAVLVLLHGMVRIQEVGDILGEYAWHPGSE